MILPRIGRRWALSLWLGCCPALSSSAQTTLPSLVEDARLDVARNGQTLDELSPLEPLVARDEQGDDLLHASALTAEARLLFRREQYSEALAAYQRAYQYAESPVLLEQIVPLAFRLDRTDEAVAYARRAAGQVSIDPVILNRLSLELTVRQDYDSALQIYRMASGPSDQNPRGADIVTRFETGRLLYLTEQFEAASDAFRKVRHVLEQPEKDPADLPAIRALLEHADITYGLMAEAALRVGAADEAEQLFRRAHDREPMASLLKFHLARVNFLRKEWALAETLLDEYLQTGETEAGVEPLELYSKVLEFQNRKEQLLPRLQKLHEAQPENLYLTYFYGSSLVGAEQWDEASVVLRSIQARQPLIDAVKLLLEIQHRKQDPAACLLVLTEGVSVWSDLDLLQPQFARLLQDEPLCQRILALSSPEQEKAYQAANTQVDSSETIQPSRPSDSSADDEASGPSKVKRRALRAFALAQMCERLEKPELAAAYYDVAIGNGEQVDVDAGLAWGLSQLMGEDAGSAATTFERVLAGPLNENERGLMEYHLSAALTMQRQFDEALRHAQAAAERLPEAAMVQARPAWILYLAQRWPEARTAYEEFFRDWNGRYQDAGVRGVVRESKFSMSNICIALGRHDEAEEWLEQVLDEFPEDVGAWNDLGYLWTDRGVHLQRAHRMIAKACEREPDNLAYRDSLGWSLYKLGRYAEAVEQLRMAAEVEDPDGVILEHLADALFRAEGPDAAIPVWKKALEVLDPADAARRQEVERKLANKRVE